MGFQGSMLSKLNMSKNNISFVIGGIQIPGIIFFFLPTRDQHKPSQGTLHLKYSPWGVGWLFIKQSKVCEINHKEKGFYHRETNSAVFYVIIYKPNILKTPYPSMQLK